MSRPPILTDAVRRAPVIVTTAQGAKTGRIVSVGGDRRTPNGRCRVQLASGAWLTPRICDVEVVETPTPMTSTVACPWEHDGSNQKAPGDGATSPGPSQNGRP